MLERMYLQCGQHHCRRQQVLKAVERIDASTYCRDSSRRQQAQSNRKQ
jgi:hypothetical protein